MLWGLFRLYTGVRRVCLCARVRVWATAGPHERVGESQVPTSHAVAPMQGQAGGCGPVPVGEHKVGQ